jgi:ParB/RepB/Spo0J family partition protein
MVEVQKIPIGLIDPPADQQRIDYDQEKLEELRVSIRDHGMINPIQVRIFNGRFELIAGSRRLRCCDLLGFMTIDAIVLDVDEKEADLLRAHENEFRHDPNPIESGIYILRLQNKHGLAVGEIAQKLNKSETYVRGRLDLMTYPEYILEPVAKGTLTVGAAHHLAKIDDDTKRRQYVAWAIWRGITASQAAAWLMHSQLGGPVQAVEQLPNAEAKTPAEKYVMKADCIICRTNDDVNNMGMYYAHENCVRAITERQDEDHDGEDAAIDELDPVVQ